MAKLFEPLAELPPAGEDVWYYPGATRGFGKDGMLLRLYRADGGCWFAMFAGPRLEPFAMPGGTRVFACGCVVNANNPADWSTINVEPILGIDWNADQSVVTFHDRYTIEAYGSAGRLWTSPVLPYDNLVVEAWDNTTVRCRGFQLDTFTDEEIWYRILLNGRSGAVLRAIPLESGD
jgi:hypothetical protein